MQVIHLSYADRAGGAGIAAYRLHKALTSIGLESEMWVNKAFSGDWTVKEPATRRKKAFAALRPFLVKPLIKTLKTDNPVIHSPAVLPSAWLKQIHRSRSDIVHLHWVQMEMLSVADIGRIRKPMLWTLHDMWAFCGAEHVSYDQRWREGYFRKNRPGHESAFDLNAWTWRRKRQHWKQPIPLVAPSQWMADCIKHSALMHDWPVSVIPNPIDTDVWAPVEKKLARNILGLDEDRPLLLFGAMGGTGNFTKGFPLLEKALWHLHNAYPMEALQLVVFGQQAPQKPLPLPFPVRYMGQLQDSVSLRILYSAADALVIPSRLDNLPNTGIEAHACGTPVVAFHVAGLPDIVEHRSTGYLAQPFDTEELAEGLYWVLSDRSRVSALGQAARNRALARWSSEIVAQQYKLLYETIH